ncbi:hypothetical protein QOT17_020390 [Balamuthia mandrillaris]
MEGSHGDTAKLSSSSSSSSNIESIMDLFEVFRVGQVKQSELEGCAPEELRRKYTLLLPINSPEDLLHHKNNNNAALATFPKEGHMIVDKSRFQTLINDKVAQATDLNLRKLRAQADERIFRAEAALEKDRMAVAELLRSTIEMERGKLMELIEREKSKKKGEGEGEAAAKDKLMDSEELLVEMEKILLGQKRVLDVVFNSPFFRPRLEGEDEGEGGEETGKGEDEDTTPGSSED